MINVAANRLQPVGVPFHQASLTADDIDRLVRFEVLNYSKQAPGVRGRRALTPVTPPRVNWDLLERHIASGERACQRQIIRRKIDELVPYYEQRRQALDLHSIPGAVITSCDENLTFQRANADGWRGTVNAPERGGILRAIDGQQLHGDFPRFAGEQFSVAAIERAVGQGISSGGRRSGDVRLDTEGTWKRSGTTVESLARELNHALARPGGRRWLARHSY